ncbi:hypothetical protein Tsubulata_026327 [Turnera subulata]|uniref:C2H2-type domain-containing protein n=1 Tax=Turnera subulata TaxID=218843 RepID=A0A9Q0J127_9ROSI|nr:hypothetical protein Tsubulata_026327 [Turnera subulata]
MAGEITVEQGQYWMWVKRRQLLKSNFQAPIDLITSSWEEKAFAEDAYGALGGCIWPPRSYSCSFCKREFRSAQALGGHMNVHRRDRARLKQSLSPHNGVFQHENHGQGPFTSPKSRVAAEVCTLDYDLEPKSSCTAMLASNTIPCSRVSTLCTQENLSHDHNLVSPYSPSSPPKEQQKKSPSVFKLSGSTPWEVRLLNISRPEGARHSRDSLVEPDLLMGFKSFISQQNYAAGSCSSDEDISCCKRPKTSVSALSSSIEPCSGDIKALQPEVIGSNSSTVEDIDLELRLG